jgi:hypothetical protein
MHAGLPGWESQRWHACTCGLSSCLVAVSCCGALTGLAQMAWTSQSGAVVQDMPTGLHGIFPIKHGSQIYIAAGGTEAAYSQSTHAYAFTP